MTTALDAMEAASQAIPWPLLWIGACLGHAFMMTVGLNVMYAWPLPRRLLKITRKIDVIAILAGPLIFAIAIDAFGDQRLSWRHFNLRLLLAPYTALCFVAGVVIAPICQVRYWLRKTAPQQTAALSEVVDVARALGYRPKGNSKDAPACSLPFNQCFQVEFNVKTLTLPQLPPAWDGLSILHLSDLHYCGTPDRNFHRFVIDRALQGGPPDIVALTGDVVDSAWHHRWIVPILGRLRCKEFAWAILGNHDHYREAAIIRRRLRKIGFRVLRNEWAQVTVRGESLVVVGDETPWDNPAPDMTGCPEGAFRLGLSHSPDTIRRARKHRVDLMLAGHVHGGQIRFPLIGSTFCPSRYSRRYDCGTFYVEPTILHVSRGVAGQHPLRFLCRPEVTKIVLRRG